MGMRRRLGRGTGHPSFGRHGIKVVLSSSTVGSHRWICGTVAASGLHLEQSHWLFGREGKQGDPRRKLVDAVCGQGHCCRDGEDGWTRDLSCEDNLQPLCVDYTCGV